MFWCLLLQGLYPQAYKHYMCLPMGVGALFENVEVDFPLSGAWIQIQ